MVKLDAHNENEMSEIINVGQALFAVFSKALRSAVVRRLGIPARECWERNPSSRTGAMGFLSL
jgi:hypothetical protein